MITGASTNRSLRTKCLTPDLQALYSNIQQLQMKTFVASVVRRCKDFPLVVIAKHRGPTAVFRNLSIVLGFREPREGLNYIGRHAWVLCRY